MSVKLSGHRPLTVMIASDLWGQIDKPPVLSRLKYNKTERCRYQEYSESSRMFETKDRKQTSSRPGRRPSRALTPSSGAEDLLSHSEGTVSEGPLAGVSERWADPVGSCSQCHAGLFACCGRNRLQRCSGHFKSFKEHSCSGLPPTED